MNCRIDIGHLVLNGDMSFFLGDMDLLVTDLKDWNVKGEIIAVFHGDAARPLDRRSIPPSLRGVFGRCCYVRVRHFQSLARKYNPSDISGLVDLGPMPRFKNMNHSILGLGSHVLGDGDMKIGVGLSPNE